MKKIIIPDKYNRNHPAFFKIGYEETGVTLINLVIQVLSLTNLEASDILDVGCGVRFTQAIINCNIPIKSYTGVDIDENMINYLKSNIDDKRFKFEYWHVYNEMYNPEGRKITKETLLPVRGKFDVIWLFSVFTHMNPPDADALLGILRSYIQPNGYLFFSAFIDNHIRDFQDKVENKPLLNAYYNESFMRQLIEQNSWRVEQSKDPSLYVQHYFVCTPD